MRPTRSSTRLQNTRAKANYKETSSDEDGEAIHVQPNKRARTTVKAKGEDKSRKASSSTKSRRRKSGKLSMLMTVPVDVFYEIASHVYPIDLLNLSRASHSLRDLLMTKHSAYVWRAAREAISLPPIPLHLSEPQYANLLFGIGCQLCDDTRARKTHFTFYIRLCKRCSDKNIVAGVDLVFQILNEMAHKPTLNEDELSLILTSTPSHNPAMFNPDYSKLKQLFFKPQLTRAIEDYIKLREGKGASESFFEQRLVQTQESQKISDHLEWWKREKEDTRSAELMHSTLSRRSKILSNLRELGYSDSDFSSHNDLPGWRWMQLVDQPRELTDKIWKNIRGELEDIISLRRERRAERKIHERRLQIQRFYRPFRLALSRRKHHEARLLRTEDLVLKPSVKALIEDGNSSMRITENQWRAIEDELPQMVEEHVRVVEQDCYDSLAAAHRQLDKDVKLDDMGDRTLLNSATAFYSPARDGIATYTYADLLIKRITTDPIPFAYSLDVPEHERVSAWVKIGYRANTRAVEAAVFLLKEIGFSPWTSMRHLKSKGLAFQCKRCPKELQSYMFWRELVSHYKEMQETPGESLHTLSHENEKAVVFEGDVDDEDEDEDWCFCFGGALANEEIPADPQHYEYYISPWGDEPKSFEDFMDYAYDVDNYSEDEEYSEDEVMNYLGDPWDDSEDEEDDGCVVA